MDRQPQSYRNMTLAIRYNAITGASLSHLDIEGLGIFEYDEMINLVSHFESGYGRHAE